MPYKVRLGLKAMSNSSVKARLRVFKESTGPARSKVTPGNVALLDVLHDPELLSMVASSTALTAKERAALSGSCKLLCLIVGEITFETTYLASSVQACSAEDTAGSLAPQLKSPPSFGLCFANPGRQQRRKKLEALVQSLPPSMHLVGGEVQTLVGTNTLDGEYSVSHDNGFALSLGAFPEATVGSFVVDPSAEVTPAEALHEQGALNAGWKVVIVLSSNVPGRILHVILQTLQTAHPDAAIIGGLATGSYLIHAYAHKVRMLSRGVVGLLFGGNVPMQALVCASQHTTARRLHEARRQLVEDQHKQLLGGLMFTCMARDAARDGLDFTRCFPFAPLVGMPCGGEIGPSSGEHSTHVEGEGGASSAAQQVTQVGDVNLQGFTAVYGLFAVPVRSRVNPLYWADVEAAYKESRQQPAAMRVAAAAVSAAAVAAERAAREAAGGGGEEEEEDSEEDDDDEYEYDEYDEYEEDEEWSGEEHEEHEEEDDEMREEFEADGDAFFQQVG